MSTTRATAWSVTLNNPTASDEECINVARQKGWKVEGQLERGASGTPHFQLMVTTPQVRASAVKRAFPRAHIEVARNAAALKQYVHKDETAEGDLPTQQEMYPSLSKFWDLITEQFQWDYETDREGRCTDPRNLDEHRWFSLSRFDDWCRHLIMRGYNIETIAVNPQTRSAWSRYAVAIVYRSIDRQDRQTRENLVAEVDIPVSDGFSSSSNEASPHRPQEEGRSVHEPSRFCQ